MDLAISEKHQEPGEAALSPFSPPSLPACTSPLLSFFLVNLLWSRLSLDWHLLFCPFALLSSSYFCFHRARSLKNSTPPSLCLLALISTTNYLILFLVSLLGSLIVCQPPVRIDLSWSGASSRFCWFDGGAGVVRSWAAPPEGQWGWWMEQLTWTVEVTVAHQPCVLNHHQATWSTMSVQHSVMRDAVCLLSLNVQMLEYSGYIFFFMLLFHFLLRYSWLPTFCWFQAHNIVIWYFYRLSFIKVTIMIDSIPCPVCYMSALYVNLFMVYPIVFKSPTSILPLPSSLSSLVTASLLSASVSLFLFCYNCLLNFV